MCVCWFWFSYFFLAGSRVGVIYKSLSLRSAGKSKSTDASPELLLHSLNKSKSVDALVVSPDRFHRKSRSRSPQDACRARSLRIRNSRRSRSRDSSPQDASRSPRLRIRKLRRSRSRDSSPQDASRSPSLRIRKLRSRDSSPQDLRTALMSKSAPSSPLARSSLLTVPWDGYEDDNEDDTGSDSSVSEAEETDLHNLLDLLNSEQSVPIDFCRECGSVCECPDDELTAEEDVRHDCTTCGCSLDPGWSCYQCSFLCPKDSNFCGQCSSPLRPYHFWSGNGWHSM